jgi:hypothetical protein
MPISAYDEDVRGTRTNVICEDSASCHFLSLNLLRGNVDPVQAQVVHQPVR